ncbi:transglutaminase family protein [Litorisediminicola beolgyonensis]|uniref:Transglutaminase domain-containing protein n=1 Tax=Litorisediminicola beolgyonensis TaxID=1173614 RepID=A0ABW3ZE49_9RHOB
MRLSVRHTTTYRFETPVRRLVQSHRLWPSRFSGQDVIEWSVTVPGALRGASFRDGAGDWTETISVTGPVEELVIEVAGEVETRDLAGVLKGHRELVPPSAYLTATKQTFADADIRTLARDALDGVSAEAGLDRAHALARAVAEAVEYVPGETEPATTAAEALAGGKGVCQDHTHVLIAAAQASDIPARYVTGYLMAGDQSNGTEASHAWAELFVPVLGWVGFDAANSCCPDDRYVRLGSGYDAQDAAPIRGVVSGQSDEALEVAVSVQPSGQSQSQSQSGDAQTQQQ